MDTHRIAEEQIARAGSQDCRRKTRKIAVAWRKHPFPGLATSPSSGYRRLVGSLFEIDDHGPRQVADFAEPQRGACEMFSIPRALANKP